MRSKAKILVLADVPGWAWAAKASAYDRYLSDEFAVSIAYQQGTPSPPDDLGPFDLIHLFEVSQLGVVPPTYRGKVIAGLTALVWTTWGKERMDAWAAKCDAMHGNSPQIVKELRAFHSRVHYCPNGVDERFFRRLRPPKALGLVACHVGKPTPRKGAALLVEACHRVGIRLLLVQRTSHFRLSAEEMRELYQEAWVYLTASTVDGTPNPCLESSACEVMQIGNAIGNLPELLSSGENGFLYEDPELVSVEHAPHHMRLKEMGRNLDWYSERLSWCQDHLGEVREMGHAARQVVLDHWTLGSQVEHVRAMWREVLA